MPRDPTSPHPEDEQARDERDHHIDDPFDVEEESPARVAQEGEELDDDDLDDLFELDELDELDDEEEEGEGPDA